MFDYKKIKTNREMGKNSRIKYFNDIGELIDRQAEKCKEARNAYIAPEKLKENHEKYKKDFINMLGWPLCEYEYKSDRNFVKETVEELDFIKISRLSIETLEGFYSTGLVVEPVERAEKAPFTVVAPGGGYSVEDLIAHGDYDCGQYKNINGRLLEKGVILYIPTLFHYNEESPEIVSPRDRQHYDVKLKAMGGSIAALEIYNIRCAIDYFIENEPIDKDKIGMIGLSYGGFYTLYTSATEPRIKSVFSSCFFSDRFSKVRGSVRGATRCDWLWQNSAKTFFDAEVAALISPRPLYLENGVNDPLFPYDISEKEYQRLKPFYEGVEKNLLFYKGENDHEVSEGDLGLDFYYSNLIKE